MSSKTVSKALDILGVFTHETPSWGLRELARNLDMSHTIVHRLLSTFEEKGFVFRNPDTHKYELGIKFIELSNVVEEQLNLPEIIQPIMKKAALETGESVVFTVLDNQEGVYVKIVESEQQVRFAESVGRRSPLYIGASHKVILAHMPIEIQHQVIQAGIDKQSQQIKSPEEFLGTLALIKKRGWFYTSGETFNDVAAVTVPLFDNKQHILGSLSVAGPSYRLSLEQAEKILPILGGTQTEMNAILKKVYFPSRRNLLS
ncbi:IclR family transcriptional regulator [Bacillus canaveralius]|uniref:IclR family transcriptional regulator n=1 Tax=Bacillus canaveralius TaxID=1403243 RepID=A0A2N5GSF7_9BACI|nr:IclR family transcriptional regulator [Bacillus canaveralius]PLR86570.1 IclR family transcriptional regulator [Bacillus canaveralius]PLS00341.1 IclR family transcriptional regulator [Bacillus canaveralius]